MMNIQNIQNVNDCVPLYLPHSLYLKPLARMNISVSLPSTKVGKSISNLDIMDKLSSALKPDKFLVLKPSKSTLEFIRFEAELDDRSKLRAALARLDGIALKVVGFSEPFKVRASEPRDEFPTRHDWDSFFRDASNMDEMKAGERPDTIHFTHLPIRWFCPRHMENEDNVKPSESIFRRIFEKFGRVRNVDIPICDPYRNKMNSDINGMKTFSFEQDVLFEAYVQFEEYVGFVRAMDEFRGMKLVRKFVDKTQAINIHVRFDKSKHLSDAQIQRRDRVRKRLINKIQSEEEERERQKKLELERLEKERKKEELLKLAELERQREREERRKEKHLKKIQERGQVEISQKIRIEERKLLIAQRKLESIRILEQLFDRIKLKHLKNSSHEIVSLKTDPQDRLVDKYKSATEKLLLEQKKKVQDIKNSTPLLGLLKIKKTKGAPKGVYVSDEEGNEKKGNTNSASSGNAVPSDFRGVSAAAASADVVAFNPFKAAVAAAAAAAGGSAPAIAAPYSAEMTTEWMKSLSMFPYMPQVFPSMPLFRSNFSTQAPSYRGYPRARARCRGPRGRGRSGYDGPGSHNSYKHYNYDDDNYDGEDSYYQHRYSYSRSNRSRSRVRSRSWSRSRTRSHSRSKNRYSSRHSKPRSRSRPRRSRSRSYSVRSRSRSWTHSRTRSRSRHGAQSKEHRNDTSVMRAAGKSKSYRRSRSRSSQTTKKLVSTRRSCSSSGRSSRSRSRSTSRTHSKRSWSRKDERSSRRSSTSRVVIETDKLVRSAEEIKRHVELDTQMRMREEVLEIKENFRRRNNYAGDQHTEKKTTDVLNKTPGDITKLKGMQETIDRAENPREYPEKNPHESENNESATI